MTMIIILEKVSHQIFRNFSHPPAAATVIVDAAIAAAQSVLASPLLKCRYVASLEEGGTFTAIEPINGEIAALGLIRNETCLT